MDTVTEMPIGSRS